MPPTTALRAGRWRLAPRVPPTWQPGPARWVLTCAAALGLGLLGVQVLPCRGAVPAALAAVSTAEVLLALTCTWLLLVQASATQDRCLRWPAVGFLVLAVVGLLRTVDPAVPGRPDGSEQEWLTGVLDVTWLLALPLAALAVTVHRRTRGGRTDEADALGVAAPWRTLTAALLLLPFVALTRGLAPGVTGGSVASGLELLVLGVAAVGLLGVSLQGYLPQARRWHQLEAQVRQLQSSSPLLPGLSITPEDETGLPSAREVAGLLRAGQVRVALQPVVELQTGAVVGAEALARFGGRVPTDRWFRAASLHGQGSELELRTLAVALEQLDGLPVGQFLAVNVSPGALLEPAVLALLHGADLARVVVEVTEHEAVRDYARARRLLAELRGEGALVAVDDVGAGFASLQHVLLLQPDVVKLDVSLVRDVHSDARRQAVVGALVTFTTEVGAVVLAEGIELVEQVTALVEVGVRLGQGWHLGKPLLV